MSIELAISDIVTAFDRVSIGTRVTGNQQAFIDLVKTAIENHDTSMDREPGQSFIKLPKEAVGMVSCGVGRHTGHQDDYCVRIHRDEPGVYLTRVNAAECTGVAVVVYTMDAYKADPQVTAARLEDLRPTSPQVDPDRYEVRDDFTHVLVAVLGFADTPKPEVSSHRFVRNLAGGNNEYDMVARALRAAKEDAVGIEKAQRVEFTTSEAFDIQTRVGFYLQSEVETMVKRAKATVEYERTWCTVAD